MGDLQDPTDGGTVPYKAIFCGDIPLQRPYIGLIYGRYLQFRFLKWPLIGYRVHSQENADEMPQVSPIILLCISRRWRYGG